MIRIIEGLLEPLPENRMLEYEERLKRKIDQRKLDELKAAENEKRVIVEAKSQSPEKKQ